MSNNTDPDQLALAEAAFSAGYAAQSAQMNACAAHPGVGADATSMTPVKQPPAQPEQTYADPGAVSYGTFK